MFFGQSIYWWMLEEYIMSIESSSNWFDILCGFKTNAHFSKGEVLINLKDWEAWCKDMEETK